MTKERMDWECKYCYKEFKTSEECDEHELNCKNKPVKIRGNIKTRFGVWEGFKFGIGIWLAGVVIGAIIFFIVSILGISIISYLFR